MKQVKLLIPLLGNKIYQFFVPDLSLKNNTKAQIVLKLINSINLILFSIFLFSLPFASIIFQSTSITRAQIETDIFKLFIIFIVTNITLFLASIVLNGKRRILDPEGFLILLVFALTITTASVVVSTGNSINTFGVDFLRSASGLMIMLVIGFYYVISLFVRNQQFFKRSISIVTFSFLTYSLFLMLNNDPNLTKLNIYIIFTAAILLFFKVLTSTKFKLAYKLITIGLIIYLFVNIQTLEITGLQRFVAVFSFFVAYLIIYVIHVVLHRSEISKRLKTIIKDLEQIITTKKTPKITFENTLSLIRFVGFLILPILFLIYVVTIYINNNLFVFSDLINGLVNNFKLLTASPFDFRGFMFGLGPDKYDASTSFISNVIVSQGLLSIIAYILLWAYAIYKSLSLLAKNKKNLISYNYIVLLSTIIIFVPTLCLFIYPGILLMILWWFAFSLVCAFEAISKKGDYIETNKADFKIQGILFRNKTYGKIGFYVRYLLVVLVIILGIVVGLNLVQFVK